MGVGICYTACWVDFQMYRIASQLLLDATNIPEMSEMATGHEMEIVKQIVQLLKRLEYVTRE